MIQLTDKDLLFSADALMTNLQTVKVYLYEIEEKLLDQDDKIIDINSMFQVYFEHKNKPKLLAYENPTLKNAFQFIAEHSITIAIHK